MRDGEAEETDRLSFREGKRGAEGSRILRLTTEYDGTDFAGFQLQGKGERTVQSVLEAAIEQVTGRFSRVHAAGRTDTGVHATGQVVHFRTDTEIPPERLAVVLNQQALPRDVTVREGAEASEGFHARFSATSRTYRYTIVNRQTPSALLGRYALLLREPLDVAQMRAAAVELTGARDFATFGLPDGQGKSTVRVVERLTLTEQRGCVRITVRGNAFLRHMVRAFVGTLVQVGWGRIGVEDVRTIRESGDRTLCPATAPPHGLCLIRVDYDGSRQRIGTQFETEQE